MRKCLNIKHLAQKHRDEQPTSHRKQPTPQTTDTATSNRQTIQTNHHDEQLATDNRPTPRTARHDDSSTPTNWQRRATATDPDKMTATPSRHLESMSSTPDKMRNQSESMSNRHGCRYGDTIRSNQHPDKMPQDNREPPHMSNRHPDQLTTNRHPEEQPGKQPTARHEQQHPDKMRNQSRTTDNRPDMIRTTYPRQLEGMSSSTPDT